MIRITRISAVSVSVLLALLFSTGAMAQSSTQQPSAREADGGERANLDSGTAQNPASMQKDTANKRIKKVNAKAELKAQKAKAKSSSSSSDLGTSPPNDTK